MFQKVLKFQRKIPFHSICIRWQSTTFADQKNSSFLQKIKEAIKNKTLEDNFEKEKVSQEIDYYELAKKVQNLSLENKEIAKQLMEIHQSILKVQEESYLETNFDTLLKSGNFNF